MADLKDKQIRLVGSQNFAYATGSSYTQGHVHFTTDEHGSIVVNGKVYGTTDASHIYVETENGSYNIPTHVNNAINLSYAYTNAKINALDGNETQGSGKFVSYVKQEDGNITVTYNTLQNLVTIENGEAAYAPKESDEAVKFIKSFEIDGDKIIPKYDYFANNLPSIPDVSVLDTNYTYNNGYYLPEISALGHTITVKNGTTRVVSYDEFNEHLTYAEEIHQVVKTFFGDLDNYDTEQLKSYIDTLSEIQNAFDNSYAESIAKSVKSVQYHGDFDDSLSCFKTWITYTTNGGTTQESAYVNIPYGTDSEYGLVKYDNRSIKKDNSGNLYVNGKLTDTTYSMFAANLDGVGAYINFSGSDKSTTNINFKGTGIAEVTYNSANGAIEVYVPEQEEINYNHHSTSNGTSKGEVELYSDGTAIANKFISSVNLSADGTLTYEYVNIKHETTLLQSGTAGPSQKILVDGSIIVPHLSFNECGHITTYDNVTITGIAAEVHSHDEFVWL